MSFRLKFLLDPGLYEISKTIYEILERTIGVKPYCLLVRFSRNIEKNSITNHMRFCIKVDLFFLKRQYGSTRIVPNSSFSKDARNENKARTFDGNL